MRPIIGLLTDLGNKDPYVAEMKAVILSICRDVTIVDITHEVRKFDVRMGAFILASAVRFFPSGTIFICVVDPGVGTGRRILLIKTKRHYLIGPDNGLLIPASLRGGIQTVVSVERRRYMLPTVAPTFHGRDVMSPVAAHLALGVAVEEFGPLVTDYARPDFAQPRAYKARIVGQVLHIDDFGNVITNIDDRSVDRLVGIGGVLRVALGRKALTLRRCKTYADVPAGSPLALIGSAGYLEIAVNQGNAAKAFGVEVGDPVQIRLPRLH